MRGMLGGLVGAACLAVLTWLASPLSAAQAPSATAEIPDLAGIWDGRTSVRPANGESVPWTKVVAPGRTMPDGTKADARTVPNFPDVNERAQAFMRVFDEALSPKYDCQPATPPALEYDPYFMEVVQWPDRVLLRYEKDDQLRTVWLDGREPTAHDYGLQGLSVGHYEGNALVVVTTRYLFDVTGFDDYNGIPSSQLKKVTERYWREGNELKATVTVEDPLFLRKAASYTTRWLPAPRGYKLAPFDCDPETARLSVQFIPSRYK